MNNIAKQTIRWIIVLIVVLIFGVVLIESRTVPRGKNFYIDIDKPLDTVLAKGRRGEFPIGVSDKVFFRFSERSLFQTLYKRMEEIASLGGLEYFLQQDDDHSARIFFGPYEACYCYDSKTQQLIQVMEVDKNGFRERTRRIAFAMETSGSFLGKMENVDAVELYCHPEAKCSDVLAASNVTKLSAYRPVLIVSGTYDSWMGYYGNKTNNMDETFPSGE